MPLAHAGTHVGRWSRSYPSVYYTFLSNVVHAGAQEYVLPCPMTSSTAALFFRQKRLRPDLIHIDASHEYADVAADLRHWWPLVRPGGALVGDDYQVFRDVEKAVKEFAGARSLAVYFSTGESLRPAAWPKCEVGCKWIIPKPCYETAPA